MIQILDCLNPQDKMGSSSLGRNCVDHIFPLVKEQMLVNNLQFKYAMHESNKYIFLSISQAMVNSGKKRSKAQPHSFHISGGSGKYIKEGVEVSFKPLPKKKNSQALSILPTFNNDRKYYTLAFRLPSTQPDRDEDIKKEHDRRVIQSQIEISQILYPKPRSKHKCCGICKDYYEDYKEHVESDPHIEKLRNSPFQKLIIEEADRIGEQIYDKKYEDEKIYESNTEDQLFKCLSIETITEGGYSNKKFSQYNIQ